MATRSSWKGCLQLSLVCIPVKAYPTTTSGGGELHLNQLAGSPWAVAHPGFPQIRTCALERIRLLRAGIRYERYTE
jgi:hypothetical protein